MYLNKIKIFMSLLGICQLTHLVSVTPDTGVPRLSDVVFSTREVHPGSSTDPLQAMPNLQAFHANRVCWTYYTNNSWNTNFLNNLQSLQIPYQGAVNTDIYYSPLPNVDLNTLGIKLDVNQQASIYILAARYLGCPSSPVFNALFLQQVTNALAFHVDALQIDDWNFNHFAVPAGYPTNPYKCYCNYCLANFRTYLSTLSPSAVAAAGVTNISTFDYRLYVLANKWDPARISTTLEKWYSASALQTFTNFYNSIYAKIQTLAGRKIPVSINGVAEPIAGPFDFVMQEIGDGMTPQAILTNISNNLTTLNRQTVYTYDGTPNATNVTKNRLYLAWVTAAGGNYIVPWDVWIPNTARYYGNPSDYADLYSLIRAEAAHIDGYQFHFATGYGMTETRSWTGIVPENPSQPNQVTGYFRYNKSSTEPLVIHLVDSNPASAQETIVKINANQFQNSSQVKFWLVTPLPYEVHLHTLAESTQNYDLLVERIPLNVQVSSDGFYYLPIPKLNPWGMLVMQGKLAS